MINTRRLAPSQIHKQYNKNRKNRERKKLLKLPNLSGVKPTINSTTRPKNKQLEAMISNIDKLLPVLYGLQRNVQMIQNRQKQWALVVRNAAAKGRAMQRSNAALQEAKRSVEVLKSNVNKLGPGVLASPGGQAAKQTVQRAAAVIRSATVYTPQMDQLIRGLVTLILAVVVAYSASRSMVSF
jgi:predicted RNase H-like nuclease (RuvC/YqgF family)